MAAVLLWSASAEQLLWASPGAAGLAEALTEDGGGTVAPTLPARSRLKALGEGVAPPRGVRLERLRFDAAGLAAPTTCACRRIILPSGDEGLLTAVVGPLPKLSRRRSAARPAAVAPQAPAQALADPVAHEAPDEERPEAAPPADDLAHLRGKGSVRFLWQADAAGRFLFVSQVLADIVGDENADLVGCRWDDLLGQAVENPSGEIASGFERRDTWSSRAAIWRIGRTSCAVAADFAGTPIFGRGRELTGFRGFGLLRTGEILPWKPAPRSGAPQDASSPTAPPPGLVPPAGDGSVAPHCPEPTEMRREGSGASAEAAEFATAPAGDMDPNAPLEAVEERSEADVAAPDAPSGSGGEPAAVDAPVGPGGDANANSARNGAFAALNGTAKARLGEPPAAPLRSVDELDAEPVEPPFTLPAAKATDTADADRKAAASGLARLSGAERSAFREIARALGARFAGDEPTPSDGAEAGLPASPPTSNVASLRPAPAVEQDTLRVLERLPVGVLVHRGDEVLFANRFLLDLVDYADAGQLAAEGGMPRLFRGRAASFERLDAASPLSLTSRSGESLPVEVRLTTVEWEALPASLMLVRRLPENDPAQRVRALELDLRAREGKLREFSSILDTATDGVIVLDEQGRILSVNRSAEALFGYDQNEVAGEALAVLLAAESHGVARDYLGGLSANGVASLLNDGREVLGRVRQGGMIPLFMTIGRVSDGPERKFCAVLRDITAVKKAEGELIAAKRAAEEAGVQKSDFLAKVSYDLRTPLSAIIGFAEVMLEERFGPVGNERYKDYLQDIHASGNHVVSLVDDLLSLAKIEAGRMELAFTGVRLNDLVSACVAEMQPVAARERIVMRTSFSAKLPPVVADERSIRQIMLNVVSNAIKFTEAGGQVIVSTAVTDRGEVAFRVRDTGVGMTRDEVTAALEPFRQAAAPRKGGGAGLGLPLTKALVEANRGALVITSARNEGTLVEVLFPPTRVLAD